ncbi:Conserved hypothetical protein CHP01589, plant [Dillenia turbinata]|uniref:Uncharacterized protein n=1 Tax=Dillenia turbinata TaxID=194707 RepID=A0AAN8VED8_9MAGN
MGDMQCNGHGDRQNGHRDRQNHMSGSNNNSINTTEFIDHVHYLIEQCLVRYMSKQETLEILWQRERIDPELTILEIGRRQSGIFCCVQHLAKFEAANCYFQSLAPEANCHDELSVENSSATQLQEPASALASEAEGGQSAPSIAPESFHYHTVSSLKDQNPFTRPKLICEATAAACFCLSFRSRSVKSEPVQSPVSMVSNHNFPMDTSKAGLMNKDALVNDANFMSLLEKLPQLRVTPGPSNGNTSDGITDPPEDLHYGEGSTELNDNPCPSIMEPSNQDNLSTSADCDDAVSKFQVEEPQMYAQNGEGMDPQQ